MFRQFVAWSLRGLLLGGSVFVSGCTLCGPSTSAVTFEFLHGAGKVPTTFIASTSDPKVVALARQELAKPPQERRLIIIGPIERDASGENRPWHWRFRRSKWHLAEMTMELCDGHPTYVEENLDSWLKSPITYCPWAARLSKEVPAQVK